MGVFRCLVWGVISLSLVACSSSSDDASSGREDADGGIDLGGEVDSGYDELDAGSHPMPNDAGGYPYAGGVLAADRFVTAVVDFTPGPCAGFGSDAMPTVVEGPPVGGGTQMGGLDVVSLGSGGTITLSFAPNGIVDGPGADFIVFENAFVVNVSDPSTVFAEPAEVSVSEDGATWTTFACTATAYPYGACAGWHPVLSSPDNGISPVDPQAAGGDAFDLKDIGVAHARFVRIVDKTKEDCPESGAKPTKNGFDLDAVSLVNADAP